MISREEVIWIPAQKMQVMMARKRKVKVTARRKDSYGSGNIMQDGNDIKSG